MKRLAIIIISLLIVSCSSEPDEVNLSFNLNLAPELLQTLDFYRVTMYGEGLPNALLAEDSIEKSGFTKVEFIDIPVGPKIIQVELYNDNFNIEYYGIDSLNVEPGHNEVHIDLHSVADLIPIDVLHLHTCQEHTETIHTLAIDPYARFLASGSSDQSVKVWDVNTWDLVADFPGQSDWVSAVVFNPVLGYLVSSSYEQINVYNPNDWADIETFPLQYYDIMDMAFNHTGEIMASTGCVNCMGLENLLTEIRLWHVGGNDTLPTLYEWSFDVSQIEFSPDGRFLAACGCAEVNEHGDCIDGRIQIWRQGDWSRVETIHAHGDWVNDIMFSPDGDQLASASDDATVKIWKVGSWTEETTLTGFNDYVYSLAYTPDGLFLIAGGYGEVKIFDSYRWRALVTFNAHSDFIWSIVCHPFDYMFATGGADNIFRVWRITFEEENPDETVKKLELRIK
jgi:WD40 repeat protein